jgi:pimeloyl-ACP methyl ester carboxylesterase
LSQKPLGLANSLRGMGAGRQEYLMPRLKELKISTFLMAGDLDTKYSQIAYQMAELIPDTAVAVTPDAGHAVHLEQPERFRRLAGTYLTLLADKMDVMHTANRHGGPSRLGSALERHVLEGA